MSIDYRPYIRVAQERTSKSPAHDFLHVQRALKNATEIAKTAQVDMDIVTPAILLHELFNYPKDHPDSHLSGDVCAEEAAKVLEYFNFPVAKRDQVLDCIRYHSFSRGVVPQHLEGQVVQDADRLDALGAIGIARLFATSAEMERPFYHDEVPFGGGDRMLDDKAYALDHVYTKLLRLADSMHTPCAREIARQRTEFIGAYLRQLHREI